jgi:alanine dehydrogenase
MDISIFNEQYPDERRVGLTPAAVQRLVEAGHYVYIEKDAGLRSGFLDDQYIKAGGEIVYAREEAFGRADLALGVSPLNESDLRFVHPGQTIMCFTFQAATRVKIVHELCEKDTTVIGYEAIETDDGRLPIMEPMSEIAGTMAGGLAARLLESDSGGRGILMGGLPGIPPANVVILGAGNVGFNAARSARRLGAQVMVIDANIDRLRYIRRTLDRSIITSIPYTHTIERAVRFADVLIGCIQVRGEKPPVLVTKDMISTMKRGAVVIDVSVAQGGCIATTRPTTFADPTYEIDGVIHCNIPVLPANVSRTASFALTNAIIDRVEMIASLGLDEALAADRSLGRGVYIYRGGIVKKALAEAVGRPVAEIPKAKE